MSVSPLVRFVCPDSNPRLGLHVRQATGWNLETRVFLAFETRGVGPVLAHTIPSSLCFGRRKTYIRVLVFEDQEILRMRMGMVDQSISRIDPV